MPGEGGNLARASGLTKISYKIVVMDFWSGALGLLLGLAANNIWERWTLYRAYRAARRLAGEWVAYNYKRDDNRSIDSQTMLGAGLTVISARSWWRPHSYVLDVHAQDLNSGQIRNHHGWIAIDPARPQRASRTVFYDDSDEIEEQRILISDDGDTLHVFDESVDGRYSKKHALRRRPVGFILNSMAPEPIGVAARPSKPHKRMSFSVLAGATPLFLSCFRVYGFLW
jgi:hypothetical protein